MINCELKRSLQSASLHPLLLMVSKVLSRSGYGDVQIMGRRLPRQKSKDGGHEILCELTQGPRSFRTVVKVVRDSVRIRNLDELAGTMIRTHADSGIVISPRHVTGKARDLLHAYDMEVSVVDGETLSAWLVQLGIGIKANGQVDRDYFNGLEAISPEIITFMGGLDE